MRAMFGIYTRATSGDLTLIKLRCGICHIVDLLSREACSLRFRAPVADAVQRVLGVQVGGVLWPVWDRVL